jgi:hypothetical protein
MADPQPQPAVASSPSAVPSKKREYRFKFVPGERFSLDHLLVSGSLEATLQFNDKLSATYRTMSIDGAQKVEQVIDPREQGKSLKFGMNELTIMQVYHTLVAINGKAIPPVSPDGAKPDPRMTLIRSLPTVFFDQIVEGLNEFDARCKELISEGAVKNF